MYDVLGFGRQGDEGDDHLFKRYAAMLEGISVVLRVVVELVGVREEIASGTEGITAAYVRAGQSDLFRMLDGEDILRIAVQRLSHFVADIGVGVLIRNDLHGILDAHRSVIGGEDEREAQFSCAA